MKQFKTVLKFEYLNYLRAKSFIVITALLLVLVLGVSFFPQIQSGFSSLFGDDSGSTTELSQAAFYDKSGIYSSDLLNSYYTGYEWTELDSIDNAEDLIKDQTYDIILNIDGLNIDLYEDGSNSMYSDSYYTISEISRTVYQSSYLQDAGLSETEINEVLSSEPIINSISVGKNASESYFINYLLLMLIYFALIFYGQGISMSVITEKTSKAMELLVTSAKPMSLMFGKVLGVGLAGLTQLFLILVAALVGININLNSWTEAYPVVGAILKSSISVEIFIYAIVFFLLGFFSFAFIYAALGSTVSKLEDANSITMIPQMLVIAAFLVGIFSLTSPNETHVTVLSFVPFFSPLLMFTRVCLLDIPMWQILISIAANIIYVILLGFISSKIYKVGIMLYGTKPKLKDIIGYIKS